jgi:hypothetical protein
MLCDHIGAILFPADISWRIIGRIAFPIFCFLIAEGAAHTRNIKRYLLRLSLFALVSEIPFDLADTGKLLELGTQNVYFTLTLGLIGIIAIRYFKKRWYFSAPIVLALAWLAQQIHTDYRWYGVLMIVFFYLAGTNKIAQAGAFIVPTQAYSIERTAKAYSGIEHVPAKDFISSMFKDVQQSALMGLVVIMLYNGKRGYNKPWVKWGFYLFYPCHLFLLYFIKTWVF